MTTNPGALSQQASLNPNLSRLLHGYCRSGTSTDAPLNSVEGFIRQIVWREYVHHVHVVTDGFQNLEVNRTFNTRTTLGGGNLIVMAFIQTKPNHLNQNRKLPLHIGVRNQV